MRIQYLLGLTAICIAGFACSSGGVGTATLDDPSLAGGGKGATPPALGPTPTAPSGGDDQTPPEDTGTGGDSGGDSGIKDTGSSNPDTGGSSICVSSCSADPVSAEQACNAAISGTTCATQYKAYYTCRSVNRVCDASGKTDEAAIASACASQQSAVTTCLGG